MNRILTGLGVPETVQTFFNLSAELLFSYGDAQEHYTRDFHKVPATQNLWLAGSEIASIVVITHSAMEAIAFLTIHRQRFPEPEKLAFIAIGTQLHTAQLSWIRRSFAGRKFILVFAGDLVGRITDIKVAAGLRNMAVRVLYEGQGVRIYYAGQSRSIDADKLSLHHFQKAFSVRLHIRTRKPARYLTFLDKLKNDDR